MTTITTNIDNGVDKIVNDVTTAAETVLPVLGELSLQIAFEYALHAAFAALLSWLTFRFDAWFLNKEDPLDFLGYVLLFILASEVADLIT